MTFYLGSIIGSGTIQDPLRPKYVDDFGPPWAAMDYGLAPICLVAAPLTGAQDAALRRHSDVLVLPALEETIGAANLDALRDGLEQRGLPGTWIEASMTARLVVRRLAQLAQLAQRMRGRQRTALLSTARDLDGLLTVEAVAALIDLGRSFRFDVNGVTTEQTWRAALLTLADQVRDITIMGEAF